MKNKLSKIGFGTYRIYNTQISHFDSLVYALNNGIYTIDTSTNYTNRDAFSVINKALKYTQISYDKIRVISKIGYIQGDLLNSFKSNPNDDWNVVKYSDDCYHAISSKFIKYELDRTLEELGVDYIDTLLLHNPEYFLYHDIKQDSDKKNQLEIFYKNIYEAFIELEKAVVDGKIKHYGISSNSFSLPKNHLHYFDLEPLNKLAKDAALNVGSETHNFTTIQLPLNLLEKDGLETIKLAKKKNLEVVVNRIFNAQKNNLMYRLSEYDEPVEYYHALNEILGMFEQLNLKTLSTLFNELDSVKHRFGWIGEFDIFFNQQVLPLLSKELQSLSGDTLTHAIESIDQFINIYKDMVAYECGKKTKIELKSYLSDTDKTLQQNAFEFLYKNKDVDLVLIGMRKVKYVEDIINVCS